MRENRWRDREGKTAREDESTIERERGTKNGERVGKWEGARETKNEDREIGRREEESVESNAEQGRGTPWANVKRQSERGLAERRDEKLDLQICPDYYEIARLPSRDAQPVLKCAFR